MKQSRPTTTVAKALTILFSVIGGLIGLASAQSAPARLTVISVHQASAAEPGDLHSKHDRKEYVVRFRLETAGDEGLYVLALGPIGTPLRGRTRERAIGSGLNTSSVSFEQKSVCLESDGNGREHWVLLPGGSAYEWDMSAAPSKPGKELSRSVCVRRSMRSDPRELLSSWYTIGMNKLLEQQ